MLKKFFFGKNFSKNLQKKFSAQPASLAKIWLLLSLAQLRKNVLRSAAQLLAQLSFLGCCLASLAKLKIFQNFSLCLHKIKFSKNFRLYREIKLIHGRGWLGSAPGDYSLWPNSQQVPYLFVLIEQFVRLRSLKGDFVCLSEAGHGAHKL